MYKTGHKITVAQCDTHLNSVKEFNPKKIGKYMVEVGHHSNL
jgi:hypothetical protein